MTKQVAANDLVSCEEALEAVLRACSALSLRVFRSEALDLQEAAGRVLSADIRADRDQPPFNRSTRDGFAVQAEVANKGAWLKQLGTVRAGEAWTGEGVGADECVEIMTGAPVPQGADTVLMLEHVERNSAGDIRILHGRSLLTGENVVVQGSEARAGDVLLSKGTRLHAAQIALAASVGHERIPVVLRPRVAVLATGDELVDVAASPAQHQIRNSNSHGIAAIVRAAGGDAVLLPSVADDVERLRDAIVESTNADLLILSGGVSAGKYDFVESVLAALGAEFFFTGVRMQPGKPVVFGRLPAKGDRQPLYFLGLPGNPVSTQVTSLLFVEPLVRALSGETNCAPRFGTASLKHEVKTRTGLTRFLPAEMHSSLTATEVSLIGWQGSGDLAANGRANCYAVIPPDVEYLPAGIQVQLLLR